MFEEDRQAMRDVKSDFEALATAIERSNGKLNVDYRRLMQHYNTIYTAATRNTMESADSVTFDVGDVLYMDYKEILIHYLLRYKDLDASSDLELFAAVLRLWERYCVLMRWAMQAFSYLSRFYLVTNAKPSLKHVAISVFWEQILKANVTVVCQVTQDLLRRQCESAEGGNGGEFAGYMDHLAAAMTLLTLANDVACGAFKYVDDFLAPLLVTTAETYEQLLAQWGATLTAPGYLHRLLTALDEEKTRCDQYFDAGGSFMLMNCVEETVLHSDVTLDKLVSGDGGLLSALRSHDKEQFMLYYSLFSRRQWGLTQLADALGKAMETESLELTRACEGEETVERLCDYVVKMMGLQKAYAFLVKDCEDKDGILTSAVCEAVKRAYEGGLRVVCRRSGSVHADDGEVRFMRFSELLAYYMDVMLYKNAAASSTTLGQMHKVEQSDLCDEIYDAAMALTYVTDHDRFLAAWRELLAQRILFPRHPFDPSREELVLSLIRGYYGQDSTIYLNGMLHDVEGTNGESALEAASHVSADGGSRDKTVVATLSSLPTPLEVSLLVTKKGTWPPQLSLVKEVAVPEAVSLVLSQLQQGYLRTTRNRTMSWSHEFSSAEVVARLGAQPAATLYCSGLQAVALLTLNDTPHGTSLHHLSEQTHLSTADLQLALAPLIVHNILRLCAPTATQTTSAEHAEGVDDDQETSSVVWGSEAGVAVNDDHVWQSRRVCVYPTLMRIGVVGGGGAELAERRARQDCKLAIDCCLIKLVKRRQSISHTALLTLCQEQLIGLYTVDAKAIKERIEALLRRGYIARDGNMPFSYHFCP